MVFNHREFAKKREWKVFAITVQQQGEKRRAGNIVQFHAWSNNE